MAQGGPPPVLKTEHVGIRVRDLDAALAFYRDLLGLPEFDRVHRRLRQYACPA